MKANKALNLFYFHQQWKLKWKSCLNIKILSFVRSNGIFILSPDSSSRTRANAISKGSLERLKSQSRKRPFVLWFVGFFFVSALLFPLRGGFCFFWLFSAYICIIPTNRKNWLERKQMILAINTWSEMNLLGMTGGKWKQCKGRKVNLFEV